jgi:CheY-like chemotaxis protein
LISSRLVTSFLWGNEKESLMSHDALRWDVPAEVPNVVVVDGHFEAYGPLAASARLGKLNLHFRSSGADAIKLARRHRVDAWLVATELDDMSGHDFLELLQSRLGDSKVAIVEAAASAGRHWDIASREAAEAGADSLLAAPITFRDLESLLGIGAGSRPVLSVPKASRAVVTLPVGVGAAVVAIAVLMLG